MEPDASTLLTLLGVALRATGQEHGATAGEQQEQCSRAAPCIHNPRAPPGAKHCVCQHRFSSWHTLLTPLTISSAPLPMRGHCTAVIDANWQRSAAGAGSYSAASHCPIHLAMHSRPLLMCTGSSLSFAHHLMHRQPWGHPPSNHKRKGGKKNLKIQLFKLKTSPSSLHAGTAFEPNISAATDSSATGVVAAFVNY